MAAFTVSAKAMHRLANLHEQFEWLASYDRETGALSTYAAKDFGFGDMLKVGYVVNRGHDELPDLFITEAGKKSVAESSAGSTWPPPKRHAE